MPKRDAADRIEEAVYMIALDGVTRYALEKATRQIIQGSLGHPFMPSAPELRVECNRIMQPHQDYRRERMEHQRRMQWDEDEKRTEPLDAEARQRMTQLWQAARPAFEAKPRIVDDDALWSKVNERFDRRRKLKRRCEQAKENPDGHQELSPDP